MCVFTQNCLFQRFSFSRSWKVPARSRMAAKQNPDETKQKKREQMKRRDILSQIPNYWKVCKNLTKHFYNTSFRFAREQLGDVSKVLLNGLYDQESPLSIIRGPHKYIMPDIWQMVTQDRSSSLKQSNNISSRFNQVRKAPAEPGGKGAAGWTLWWELQPCSAENPAARDEEGRSYILALCSAAPSLLAMADL